ncbi:hypothetical protein [Cellulomonas oligotrophica]|uniref:Lipoprotein n=1 Tax=Cellulomonas oligotrophica TaxID=931536 RepID=A0A7Y9FDD1_9CELL|nr:hypothetical protein [Cellulomonas oligotrophica]NYD85125.1 hypothetical protein [Cellulomonas oligotrophica]GIG33829.1 hypothetical protein Col01nite_29880 [Cellulomonas oligotrophica]
MPRPTPARPRTARGAGARTVGAAAVLALLAGCTWGQPETVPAVSSATFVPEPAPEPVAAELTVPDDLVTSLVPDGSGPVATSAAAVAASRTLFASAPVAVLTAHGDVTGGLTAASAAVAVGAPVLVVPPDADAAAAVVAEVERLGATAVLVVGGAEPAGLPADVAAVAVPAGADPTTLATATGVDLTATTDVAPDGAADAVRALDATAPTVLLAGDGGDGATASPTTAGPATPTTAPRANATLPATLPPVGDDGAVLALAGERPVPLAVLATLRAAGAEILDLPGGDPRATTGTVQALADADPAAVLQLTSDLGATRTLTSRVQAAVTGVELPGGGQLVFPEGDGVPGKRYVALYGTPGTPSLGVLGEQDVPATLARTRQHATPFRDLTDDVVVPAVEIIATVASAGPGDDGDYSQERSVDDLRPLVDAAREDGAYVVLDLQPGRTDFRTQAQRYAELLAEPHVGLALDPEWRLAPDQVHLRQIGSVSAAEINQTSEWLARFTRERDLPQKMLVLHQFSLRMISDRQDVDTSHDELAVVIHVDGQGTQPAKRGTWDALRTNAPDVHWGWKNFYDEDEPMLDPAQTYQVDPVPDLVTYQ